MRRGIRVLVGLRPKETYERMKRGLHSRHLIFHGAVLMLILGLLILDFLLRVIEWRAA